MAEIYWDPTNGSDANTGLTIDSPIQTVTKIGTIGLNDGDEIRMLRNGASTLEAGTGNVTYVQGSQTISCPADFPFGSFSVGDLIMAPNDKFYFISAVQPGAADELELCIPYEGSGTSVPAVRRVSIARPGPDKIADFVFDTSLHFTTTPVLISGGWYDSGGAVAAQETVNSVVVPSYYRWFNAGGGANFFNNTDLGFEGFVLNDLAFEGESTYSWLVNDSANEGDIVAGENSSVNYMRDFELNRVYFTGWNNALQGPMDQSVTVQNIHAFAMDAIYHFTAAGPTTDMFRDLTLQNFRLGQCGAWKSTGTITGISERLVIDNITVYDNTTPAFLPNSLICNVILGQALFGVKITNCTLTGDDTGGVFLIPRAWGADRKDIVPNLIENISMTNEKGDFVIGSLLGAAGNIKIKDITINTTTGGVFGAMGLYVNSDRECPVVLTDIQITGATTGINWSGVGHYLLLASDPGLGGIVFAPLDVSYFGDSLLNADFPGMMRTVDDVGGVPGNELGYVGDLVRRKELTIDTGTIAPDTGVQVSGKSIQWTAPGDVTEAQEGSFPFFVPVLAGQRTVAAKLRKTASFDASISGLWPRLRVVSRSWNGGNVIVNENIVSINPATNDVFEDVSQILVLDHDQTVIVYWEGLDESDVGSMWLDDLTIQ